MLLASSLSAADAGAEERLPAGAIARLGVDRFRIGPQSTGLALSPDGRFLATCDAQRSGTIHLIDATSGRVVRTMGAVHFHADRFAFAGTNRLFASNSVFENAVQIYDHSQGGAVSRQFTPRSGERITRFVPAADGRTLVTIEDQNHGIRVQVVDVGSGRGTRTLPVLHNEQIHAALSADGGVVVTWGRFHPGRHAEAATRNRTIQVWDAANGKLRTSLLSDQAGGGVAVSPDGQTLAVASKPTEVELRAIATGKSLARLTCRAGDATALVFSPDGRLLAGVSPEAGTHLWEVRKHQTLGKVDAPVAGTFSGLGFPGGDKAVVCVREGCAIHLWETPSGKRLTPTRGPFGVPLALGFRSDGKELHAVDSTGWALAWHVPNGRELHRRRLMDSTNKPKKMPPGVHAILSADSRQAILGGLDPGYTRFDPGTGKETRTLGGGGYSRFGTAPRVLAPDGHTIALREGGKIRLVDPGTGEVRQTIPAQPGGLARMAFSPDGKTLALASSNDPILGGAPLRIHLRLWDVAAGKPGPGVDEVSNTTAATLAFSPAGGILALEGRSGNLRLLDANTLALLLDGPEEERPTTPFCFAPDGRCLAAGLSGGRVAIWETLSGKRRRVFHTGGLTPTLLAFSPDGRLLASGGTDSTILLWDRNSPLPGTPENAATAAEIAALWAQVESNDAEQAYSAMQRLVRVPALALPWLRKNLEPVPGRESLARRLDRLVVQLDDNDFEIREQASLALEALGGDALPVLYRARKAPSVEVRARTASVLKRIQEAPKAPWLRSLRGVEILEQIGTPQAVEVLARLARGNPHAALTREAKSAQARLAHRLRER